MPETLTAIFRAAAVRDAAPVNPAEFRPGSIAVRGGRIIAVGEPEAVEKEVKDRGPWNRIDLPDRLILPAMVNAHAHLDLTDIGPVPYEAAERDFVAWIGMVMKRRPQTEEAITAAVRHGLRLSRAAGVAWLGDIAGSEAAVRARMHAGNDLWVSGTSYLECFGIGRGAEAAGQAALSRREALVAEVPSNRLGQLEVMLQPHAPYSAGLPLYRAASGPGDLCPSTHLAETTQEAMFVRDASGPLTEFLKRIGKWDETIRANGLSPLGYLSEVLHRGRWLVAHCNHVDDDDIAVLRNCEASVAYCPIASEYFGHANHRYRDMLAADVNVCLGTDSILCQPPGEPQPLGIMAPLRRLYRRDKTDPATLLALATWRGVRAIRCARVEENATLKPRAEATLISVRINPTDPTDALVQALSNDNLVEPLPIPREEQT